MALLAPPGAAPHAGGQQVEEDPFAAEFNVTRSVNSMFPSGE